MTLQEYLDKQHLTGLAFAKKNSLSQSTISRILNDKVRPSPDVALKIEEATKGLVSLRELLYADSENKTASSPQS